MSFLGLGESDIGNALIRVGADTRMLRSQMAAANAQLRAEAQATGQTIQRSVQQTGQQVERQAQGWGKAFGAVKLGLIGLGIGLGAFTIDAIKTAREFDRTMGQVYALTGATGEEMAKLRGETLELAKVLPQSPQKLAEGLYYILSSGIDAAHAMDVLKISAMDATVGLTDVNTIADAVTSVLNAYGLSGEHAAEVSDLMTQTIVKGKAEWADLAKSIGPAAVQAATAGVSFKEVSATIAEMTQIGMTAQRSSRNLAFEIRALEAPNKVAQKEFKALGITVNAVTLAHDGLYGTIKRIDDALGGHREVIVRNAKAQIDYAASAAATEKANVKWAEGMKAATGGAAGFLVAQVQLLDHGRKYIDILHSMDDAAGLTEEAFEKMKASDPGFVFDLLKNRIQVAAIEFGNNLMPKLGQFLNWALDAVPHAFAVIGAVWQNKLSKPIGDLLAALGDVISAFFGMWGAADSPQGDAFATLLGNVASVIAQIARDGAVVARAIADAFGNPVVQAVTKVLILVKGIQIALGIITGLGGSLSRGFMGMASRATFGLIKPPGAAGLGATPLDKSAANLTGSAAALKEAAAALKGAGIKPLNYVSQQGLAGGFNSAYQHSAVTGYGYSSYGKDRGLVGRRLAADFASNVAPEVEGAFLTAVPLKMKADYLAHKGEFDAMGKTAAKQTADRVVTTVKGALSGTRNLLSRGLGLVSSLFFPALIADLGLEFIKAPLGQFIGQNPAWKRAGAEMQENIFGGIIDLLTKSMNGADAAVGRADFTTIGTMRFSTVSLAKLGITNAIFDKLEAPIGTIEHAQGVQGVIDALPNTDADAFTQKAGESLTQWWGRIRTGLSEELKKKATDIFNSSGASYSRQGVTAPPAAIAAVQAYLRGAISGELTQLQTQTREDYLSALTESLKGMGFTTGQVNLLTTPQLATLGAIVQKDAAGRFAFVEDYLTNAYLDGAKAKHGGFENLPEVRAKLAKAFGSQWEKLLAGLADGKFPKTSANTALVAKLKKTLGADWQDILSDALAPSGRKTRGPSTFAGELADLKQDAAAAGAAIAAYIKDIPPEVNNALNRFIRGTQSLPTSVITKLEKKFGSDWLIAFRDGTSGITNKPVDKSIVTAMVAQFGPHWRAALQGFGELLFEREGGADEAALKKALADAISKEIAALTPAELGAKDGSKTRKSISTYLNSTAGKAALDAASSSDAKKAKAAWTTMNSALSKNIPDASARERFIGTLVALDKATKLPTDNLKDLAGEIIPDAATALKDAGSAFQWLTGKVRTFLSIPGLGGSRTPERSTGTVSPTGTTSKGYGFGGYATKGQSIWAGEFGPELLPVMASGNVLSTNKVASLLTSVAKSAAGAATHASRGSLQQLFVDTMNVGSPAEDQSILETVQFLAPAGR